MHLDLHIVRRRDLGHGGVDGRPCARDLRSVGGAEVDAQHRQVRHDIVRTAAVDPRRVHRQARALGGVQRQRQRGGGDDRVAPVLRIAPGMGRTSAHDDREIARAPARAGQGAVGQGRLIGEGGDLAAGGVLDQRGGGE